MPFCGMVRLTPCRISLSSWYPKDTSLNSMLCPSKVTGVSLWVCSSALSISSTCATVVPTCASVSTKLNAATMGADMPSDRMMTVMNVSAVRVPLISLVACTAPAKSLEYPPMASPWARGSPTAGWTAPRSCCWATRRRVSRRSAAWWATTAPVNSPRPSKRP